MTDKILVTGASGNVGRAVAKALADLGIPVRLASASVQLPAVTPSRPETVRLDFRDAGTFANAARGCSAVFLMRPPAIADTRHTLLPFIDAAHAAGARQIVFLSVIGADKNALVPHHAVELHLAASREPYTLLRPGFFAQNLGDAYLRDIVEDDRLYVPAGKGRVTFVDVRDVAEVAALAFADAAAHNRKAYSLTGPQAVSFSQVAHALSCALSRTIRYDAASIPGYLRHLRRRNLPWAQAAVQTILHVGLRFGQAAQVDLTLARLLGRPGRSVQEYIADHVALWATRAERDAATQTPASAAPRERPAS